MSPSDSYSQQPPRQLIDRFNRNLNYLRVSITDRCNLRCIYCMPHIRIPKLHHDDILTYEEILRVVETAVKLGVTKVRVTGGEPLVRKGVYAFLKALTQIDALKDVSLTTNGVLLAQNAAKIRVCGIKRINISLDTLQAEKYRRVTGFDQFHHVWSGIEQALDIGFAPIKLNVVAIRGINDDEILDFARLSMTHPLQVRFIEHMPIGTAQVAAERPLLTPEIKRKLKQLGHLTPVGKRLADGPAQRYRYEGAKGEVGFISAMSRHFCNECNRLRLTADGQLRPCLLSDMQLDVKGLLRKGGSDKDLSGIFLEAVHHKPSDHNLAVRDDDTIHSPMSKIGG